MDLPQTKYVTVGGAQVAYQVVGDGPPDLTYCYALGAHVDLSWQVPNVADFLTRMTDGRRLILFDRRGSGASDALPLDAISTWEELAEDLTAVLDAAGSERTALLAQVEAGPLAILFAAMHPERVTHLILFNTSARFLEAEDYPIGVSSQAVDELVELLATSWGSDDFVRMVVPSFAEHAELITSRSRMFRASATPRAAAAQYEYFARHVDVRRYLPLVQVPTLVFHSRESPVVPIEHGRYLAEHISGSQLIELSGSNLVPSEESAADIVEFLTGERPIDAERLLATVLFTDIVGSTEQAVSMGDRNWHTLLDAHNRSVREQVRRFRGNEVNTTGDGFVVSFDGPARAIRCAQAIEQAVRPLGVALRLGLHTGECDVRADGLGGLAVHIAARVGALAKSHEILVSSTLRDLVAGSGIEFADRGEHDLKGVPGAWKLFSVVTS